LQLAAKSTLALGTLNAFAVATKRACLSGLRLLLLAQHLRGTGGLQLLAVHHVLHERRHVATHLPGKTFRARVHLRNTRERLLLQRSKACDALAPVLLVRIGVDVRECLGFAQQLLR